MSWRAHRGIILLLVVFVAFGIWYSVTTPLFETPDEREHFAFVQYLATGHGLPMQSEQPTHLAKQEGSQPPLYYALASALTFWIDTSDFPAFVWENPHYGYNIPGIVNDNKNLFIHTAAESLPYHNAVLAIRLARWLSVLMGALAVWFTYWLARELFPAQNFLALSAAAIVAFTPQFIFISGAVSNDSTITALAACALWLMVRAMNRERRLTIAEIILLGIVCGLAAIAKVSGAGLSILAVLVFGWIAFQSDNTNKLYPRLSAFVRILFVFGVSASLVAAWWYLRNLTLYGELTGTEMMSRIFFARQTPLSFDQLVVQLREVWETFWVGFGWGNIRAQPAIYVAIEIFVMLGVIGLFKFIIYDLGFGIWNLPKSETTNHKSKIIILFTWFAIVFVALVRWMIVTQAPHGRLMFPALPALAVLVVFGLAQFHAPRIMHHVLPGAFALFLAALAFAAPLMILRPAYAYPQTLSGNAVAQIPNRVDIAYDDQIKLLGYAVSSRTVYPGDAIELTLYWQALAPMDADYSIGIRVLDANQRVIGTRDSYPGHGMLPTRLWRAGQIFHDVYWLPINADAPEFSIAQIQVVVYDRISKRDLLARDPRGETITPFIGRLKIVPSWVWHKSPQKKVSFVFGGQIELIGYAQKPDSPLIIDLYWKRVAPITRDYTVLVTIGGHEFTRQPWNGANPTSLWESDEIVIDEYNDVTPVGKYRIRVSLYDANTGERLTVADAQGNILGDELDLGIFDHKQ